MKAFFIKIITGFFLIAVIFSPVAWAAEPAGIAVTVTLEQLEAIEATVEFRPEIIRLGQRFLRCYTELPEPFKVEDIDIDTVALTEVNGTAIDPPLATAGPSKIGDYDRDGVADLVMNGTIGTADKAAEENARKHAVDIAYTGVDPVRTNHVGTNASW